MSDYVASVDAGNGGTNAVLAQAKHRRRKEAALAYCDSMTRQIHIPAEIFASVRAALDERCLVELTATIGAYNMVSRFIEALGIDSKDELSTREAGSHVQP